MSFSCTSSDDPLPPYSVRVSNRAKRLQLKVSSLCQVEVVVPKGLALHYVPEFVSQHRQWIQKTLLQVKLQRPIEVGLPKRVTLQAVNEVWQVQYQVADRSGLCVNTKEYQLTISGRADSEQLDVLRMWLSQHAKVRLIPWLTTVSMELSLPFKKAAVRAQKTRWGSCSSRHHISLNRALLFMSPAAVRYLFIHELCHTKHLNHSSRFWGLVARYEPNHRVYELELRQAASVIPTWALAN